MDTKQDDELIDRFFNAIMNAAEHFKDDNDLDDGKMIALMTIAGLRLEAVATEYGKESGLITLEDISKCAPLN